MSWYDETIGIKRGTLYQFIVTLLLMMSISLMAILIIVLTISDMESQPVFWLCSVVVLQQFFLSGGLLFALQGVR